MKPWEVIKQLQNTPGRLDKESILRDNLSVDLKKGLALAYDPFITFNIKQLPKWSSQVSSDMLDDDFDVFDDFKVLATSLSSRLVTGNAAKDAVRSFTSKCTHDQWEYWFKRILAKDMKCGVLVTTWNKITDDPVFVFECQLATDTPPEDVNEVLSMSDVFLEPKFDGVRALTFVYPDGNVQIFSRNGKQLDNFTLIEQEMSQLKVAEPMVFDGEMMSANFQKLMTQINRKQNVDTSDSIYYVFDCLTKQEFVDRKCTKTLAERKTRVVEIIGNINSRVVEVSPYFQIKTGSLNSTRNLFDELVNQGYEGMMIKPSQGRYMFKRSKDWLKMKPFIDVTLEIIGFELGKPDSRFNKTLGNLVCEGTDKSRHIKVDVGGGFSDELRNAIWNNQNKLLGQKVDIRADCLTLAEGETTYSLRFPRFERFREDWDL